MRQASQHAPALHWYYLGYYIHSCPRMRYKAEYQPLDVLCPQQYCWVPYAVVKPAMDVSLGHLCNVESSQAARATEMWALCALPAVHWQ